MSALLHNEILILLAVVFLGGLIGLIKVKGIGFGTSACLFVGLIAGLLGATIPPIIEKLGILFFVYSLGLSMGPRFFYMFRGKAGIYAACLALATALIGAVTAVGLGLLFNLPAAASVGSFAGALTSTPTLASAVSALIPTNNHFVGEMSVAYTITYPLGFLLIVLFIQYVPRLFEVQLHEELKNSKLRESNSGFQVGAYKLQNEGLIGKTIDEIRLHEKYKVNITRIKRGDVTILMGPNVKFERGDIAVAVGLPEEMASFETFFGKRCDEIIEPLSEMQVKDIVLASSLFAARPLRELKIPSLYGVLITRIRRSGTNITPHGDVKLEMGDELRIVGSADNLRKFVEIAGSERKKLDETNVVILALGMLVGYAVGEVPIKAGLVTFKLGAAGGPLIVALLLGYFGRIGPWSVRLPIATRIFLREFGLVFFLSAIGISSGGKLTDVISGKGVALLAIHGASVAVLTMAATFFIARHMCGHTIAGSLGAICGSMTSTPALAVLMKEIDDETPAFSYASVYPMATIILTLMGQVLVMICRVVF